MAQIVIRKIKVIEAPVEGMSRWERVIVLVIGISLAAGLAGVLAWWLLWK